MPQRICIGCTQPYEAFYKVCPLQLTPKCAEPYTPQTRAPNSAPEQVDGDLFELDVETLRALFAKISDANMSDEDFELDMAARGVPQIGRSKQLKHHRAGVHRRKVLLHLIGWWVGAQPGRALDEIHRRFNYRFGIDIGSAQALSTKDTDALIETIARRFNEDLAA